jgi:hypothetical protein
MKSELGGNRGREERRRIAVLGSGISGLSAAWLLAKRHQVTLYEIERRPGGHSNTVVLPAELGSRPVDTGFIVFNEQTYGNLTALFRHLGVPTAASEMSFAASLDGGRFEYSGSGLRGLLAQRRNVLRPRFWAMLLEVLRFYREAADLARDPGYAEASLGAVLRDQRYGATFIADHLLPMGAAIWSVPPRDILDFPFVSFVRFFENHGLLKIKDRPVWRTVVGGSREYVRRMLADSPIDLKLGCTLRGVRRGGSGPALIDSTGTAHRYDDVVLACHSDQALRLLEQPTAAERVLLGAIRYQPNDAVLHTDSRLMPVRRRAWASWNVLQQGDAGQPVAVTYWMNRLQPLALDRDVFVSLNPVIQPRAATVIQRFSYAHPMFDAAAMDAQKCLWSLQGEGGVWFCGAYFGSGFHEDGLQAGLAVAEAIGGVARPWTLAEPSDRIRVEPAAVRRRRLAA